MKIKIKKDKEDKALDTENKDWFRDIEIEITNTSDKPIYFFSLHIVIEDVPIEPKATQTFTFEETNIIGYEAWRRNNKKNDPLKVEVWFSHLSFGDGTGFTSMGALPFPFKEEEVGRCFEKPRPPDQWATNPMIFSALYAESFRTPADFLPVIFFCIVLLPGKTWRWL